MKVTVERLPQSTVRLDIAADEEEFRAALERALRRISQQVQVPGFRPGRAPRTLVERRVGRELIVAEAQRELMDRLYREALQQHQLVPVSDPEVEIYQDEPLAFGSKSRSIRKRSWTGIARFGLNLAKLR